MRPKNFIIIIIMVVMRELTVFPWVLVPLMKTKMTTPWTSTDSKLPKIQASFLMLKKLKVWNLKY